MARGRPAEFSVTSHVTAPPERVWERVITPEGINDEMRPWMRMTMPEGIDGLTPETIELGVPIGRSWILLFGLLPFDYDDVTVVEMEEGHRFLERSRMLSQRSWEHERTIVPDGEGSGVTDRIRMEPRLGIPGALLRPTIRTFFRHRHRRLRRHFSKRAQA